jgi:galactose mutarotase-like enzyme
MSRHHYGARIHDYTAQGYRTIALENPAVRVEIVADKGSDIVSFLHKASDIDFMWHRPTGLRPAPFESIPRGIDEFVFVDGYEGGWQECFPNGGRSVVYKGAELPFHGEWLAAPFTVEVLEDSPEVVSVRMCAETMRTPFRLEKTLTLRSDRPVLEIDEKLSNLADEPMDVMWGHHPAYGPPFLDDSCRIDLPPCKGSTERTEPWPGTLIDYAVEFDWPLAPQKDGGRRDLSKVLSAEARVADWVRLSGFEDGWYGVTNGRRRVGFGLRWDPSLFKHLWFWHVFGGMPGYPWYGRNYAFALEPWTSHPDGGLNQAIENGSAHRIGPLETVETRLLAVAYQGVDRIGGITESGEVLG